MLGELGSRRRVAARDLGYLPDAELDRLVFPEEEMRDAADLRFEKRPVSATR